MAHQNERHLTTEQLSALLDDQLSLGERIDWHAHLSACQECQAGLADLRRTVALLHALPQAELPRSFVLPARATPASERLVHPVPQVATVGEPRGPIIPMRQAQRGGHPFLRRSLRAMSTLAAVIGFLLIMSGFLANVHISGGGAASAPYPVSSSNSFTANHTTVTPSEVPRSDQSAGASTPTKNAAGSGTPAPQQTQTPSESLKSAPSAVPVQDQNARLPAALDLSTSMGQVGVGLILLVLGFLGLIATRLMRRRAAR